METICLFKMKLNSHIFNYKFEHNGQTYAGELHGNYLWTNEGSIKIPEGVIVEVILVKDITQPYNPYSTKEPETNFEIFQFNKYGNFYKDTEDLSDEDRQSEVNERYIQFNLDK
jgi:hypothetical protein